MLLGSGSEQYASRINSETSWSLISCSIDSLNQVNNPPTFFSQLSELNIPFPSTRFEETLEKGSWLYKQALSCGGMGVSRVNHLHQDPGDGYWQQELKGQSMSLLCLADGDDYRMIGINELYSHAFLESHPYVYEGAVANFKIDIETYEKIDIYIEKLVNHFNLVGMFSLDMVIQDITPYALEINPRISASYELYELLNPGLNLVDAHIRVCEGVRLSDIELGELTDQQIGYKIVYADEDYVVPSQLKWPQWVKDKPEKHRFIASGEPICSIFSDSEDTGFRVRDILEERKNHVLNIIKQ